ncbi:MAG: hypothetical protein RIT15_1494 [Pseudomonadota bacterium]
MSTKTPIKKAPAVKTQAAAKKVVAKKIMPVAAPTPTPLKSKPEKALKPVKPKLIRDSFTIPKDEYQVLADLKTRMTKLMQPAKKSELLRAGLKALAAMPDATIKKALLAVPSIKTGRPAKVIKK